MRRTLLVAGREYAQVANTRGFWITLLAVPIMLAISIASSIFFRPPSGSAYMLIDQTGGRYAAVIAHRLELDQQRSVLTALAAYGRRWNLAAPPAAPWASSRVWFSDPEVEAFIAAGGAPAVVAAITPRLPKGAPAFVAPQADYLRVPPPRDLDPGQTADRIADRLVPLFQGEIQTPVGRRSLAAVILIPRDFGGPAGVARAWTGGAAGAGLVDVARSELSRELRRQALQAQGLSPQIADRIDGLSAPIDVRQPVRNGGRSRVIIRSLVPLALVYLLLMTTMTTGALMLQGVIEERSNKLLETLLACVSPSELMHGKLIGLGAVGLTVVVSWAGFAIGAVYAARGALVDVLAPSLAALDQPWMIAALLFYFLTGYLIVSMAYLAIGSVSDSMQDAQGYMVPMIMLIIVPVSLMISSTISDPNGPIPMVLSWIPVYTPFAMLARFGAGVSPVEIIGTGLLTLVFVALEYWMLGKIFQSNLLNSGQSLKSLLKRRPATA